MGARADDLWSWLGSNSAPIGVIATVLTAIIAALALRATVRDSHDRTRAYIAVDLVPASRSGFSAVLRVVNVGQSVARDVQITFTPPLEPRETGDTLASVHRRYAEPIANISPGQELKNTWQTWADHGTLSSAPERCTVSVAYRSGDRRRLVTETFVLDVGTVGAESDPVASNSELGAIRRIAASVETIASAARR